MTEKSDEISDKMNKLIRLEISSFAFRASDVCKLLNISRDRQVPVIAANMHSKLEKEKEKEKEKV